MKTELTSLDLHYLVREFQGLVGARVDKVYEQSDDLKDFMFQFRKGGEGRIMLRIKLPGIAYLTESKGSYPETPPGFCVFLRKHIGGSRIVEVRQRGFERILEIVFDAKEAKGQWFASYSAQETSF
jgi:predicted ribosome quality control (RQC) complex YloA/Tae2 family protein